MNAIPAALWEPAPSSGGGGMVLCRLCAHGCRILPGKAGRCGVRVNHGGSLFSLSSASVEGASLDPVEKKPLFHFLPGTSTLSFGAPGCTMRCSFCQNHTLSQVAPSFPGTALPGLPPALPEQIVRAAQHRGAASISFTYSEPTVFHELVTATAEQATAEGLACILVSNGYQSAACLENLRHSIHAANFDLKSFRDEFYREHCGARLEPVLQTLRRTVAYGWWVEVTTLLIPGCNDSPEELRHIATFIANELGPHVPWHVSRFRPAYRMRDRIPTPQASLERALEAGAEAGLFFVYAGNIPGHPSESTRCPHCGMVFISRTGYASAPPPGKCCTACGASIPGLWDISQLSSGDHK
ncbi:AmmeMemoRadiSam system radical SAM enzyme [Desulfovibrio sp. OttesenSCG-928-I05]|nr:AmmeMemoRadiSam system radical SAM enzyme [Desulfovibrio sp. OttesenSCG-928-I05]